MPVGCEEALTEAIIQLASDYGRYGYRRISALEAVAAYAGAPHRLTNLEVANGSAQLSSFGYLLDDLAIGRA